MCTQIRLLLLCPCPHRDTPLCPHHLNLLLLPRSTPPPSPSSSSKTLFGYTKEGYKLRIPTVLQSHISWTPEFQQCQWIHCAGYKLRHRKAVNSTTNTSDGGYLRYKVERGKELACPVTRGNTGRPLEAGWTKVLRVLCSECRDGHQAGNTSTTCTSQVNGMRAVDDDVAVKEKCLLGGPPRELSFKREETSFETTATTCMENRDEGRRRKTSIVHAGRVASLRGDSSWITKAGGTSRGAGVNKGNRGAERYGAIVSGRINNGMGGGGGGGGGGFLLKGGGRGCLGRNS
ncbi:hypothetical protein QBC43DRAFT_353294 [Cladorrhinum sp. PSN259]|nr:hypothetical protein QBC43DRAFT_353294 [Cladorrhinum sp. PSN259]